MQEISRNIGWEFTDKTVTPWGGMRMFKEFLDKTGMREELKAAGLPSPGSNCGYDPVLMVESFWVNVWLGGVNFSHTAMVRFDDGLTQILHAHTNCAQNGACKILGLPRLKALNLWRKILNRFCLIKK